MSVKELARGLAALLALVAAVVVIGTIALVLASQPIMVYVWPALVLVALIAGLISAYRPKKKP